MRIVVTFEAREPYTEHHSEVYSLEFRNTEELEDCMEEIIKLENKTWEVERDRYWEAAK